jgi:hypothetical protein
VLLLVVEGLTQQLISRVATPAIDALMRHSQEIQPGFFYFKNENGRPLIFPPIKPICESAIFGKLCYPRGTVSPCAR